MKPESHIGYGSLECLNRVLDKYSARIIFLVTGKKSFLLSGAEAILRPLTPPHVFHRFFEFSENPNINDLDAGVELFRQQKPDLILAIGGGSVIDMAKLIKAFSSGDKDVREQLRDRVDMNCSGLPLIAVPTTAGTGSEATQFATLYIDDLKHSLSDDALLPDVAIVDPVLTHNLSPRLTAISGMDALSQAIESFWSVRSTEESKRYAGDAMRIIGAQLPRAVHTPSRDSRLAMAQASHLAGKAINITTTTAPHALSYPLTSRFGVPHGQAVSLTLPSFINFNYGVTEGDVADPRGVDYVRRTLEEISRNLDCGTVREASARVRKMMIDIGLATRLTELQINKENAIETVTREVNMERLVNNPRSVSEIEVKQLLRAIG